MHTPSIFRWLLRISLWIVLGVALAIVLHVFFVSTFNIPTHSMVPALLSGDAVVVNKLIPGTRMFRNFDFLETNERPPYYRLPAWRSIKRNDVLVFNFPYAHGLMPRMGNVYYVKRCVALPGDSFYIENGVYKVKSIEQTLGNVAAQKTYYSQMAKKAKMCFPNDSAMGWTDVHMGPLYIPAKGDTIQVNALNAKLYGSIIAYETGKMIKLENNEVFLNDSVITNYCFDMDYYFVTGDNVENSFDSRYWGFVPDDHVVGVAWVIHKSVDLQSNKTRWSRWLKRVR